MDFSPFRLRLGTDEWSFLAFGEEVITKEEDWSGILERLELRGKEAFHA